MLMTTPTTRATRTTSGRKKYSCTALRLLRTPPAGREDLRLFAAAYGVRARPPDPRRARGHAGGVTGLVELAAVLAALQVLEVLDEQLGLLGVDVDHADEHALGTV